MEGTGRGWVAAAKPVSVCVCVGMCVCTCVCVKITGRFLRTAAWSPRPHVKCGLNLQHTAGLKCRSRMERQIKKGNKNWA